MASKVFSPLSTRGISRVALSFVIEMDGTDPKIVHGKGADSCEKTAPGKYTITLSGFYTDFDGISTGWNNRDLSQYNYTITAYYDLLSGSNKIYVDILDGSGTSADPLPLTRFTIAATMVNTGVTGG